MKKLYVILVACILCSCADNDDVLPDSKNNDVMFQYSNIQSLLDGKYDGIYPIAELKNHGDFGVGTFDKINGEMIILDGVLYQALGDGSVVVADEKGTTPFANISWLDNDKQIQTNEDLNETQLGTLLSANNPENQICMVRIDGNFQHIVVRSELAQLEKPYKPLMEVLATDERQFSYEQIDGTIVGVYFPEHFAGLNSIGWHFHFISSDKKKGGHVVSLTLTENATCTLDYTSEFRMKD